MSQPTLAIAIGNVKGGAGKTTTALGLAEAFGDRGLRTAVIDVDPDAAATEILEPADTDAAGAKELLNPDRAVTVLDCLTETGWPNIWLCQAEDALRNREDQLADDPANLTLLRRRLGAARGLLDVIIVDLPPTARRLGLAGLIAADRAVAVTEPTVVSARRAQRFIDTLVPLAQTSNPDLRLGGLIITSHAGWQDEQRVTELLVEQYGHDVLLPPVIKTSAVPTTYESLHMRLRDSGNRYAKRVAAIYDQHADRLLSDYRRKGHR